MYAILYSQSGRKTAQTRRERIMDFVKERNFIVAYENGTYQAKWDILTGHYYGKSGKAVHGTPHAFIYDNLAQTWQKQVSGYVRFYREWFQNDMRTPYTQKRGARYEQLMSLGLRPSQIRDLDSSTKLTKDLVNYLVENNNGVYSSDKVNLYLKKNQYGKLLESLPDWAQKIFLALVDTLPLDYLTKMLSRVEHEHVNMMPDWYNSDIITMIEKYYNKCMTMYGEVKVTPNVLSNYAQICYLYENYKRAHYNESIVANNDKPFLYFQYGNYEARPILSSEAFHEEAEAQHNCVERLYMNKVVENQTYIVTVRRIDKPEKSLITCEVSHNKEIRQYLTYCNQRVIDEEQIQFYKAYVEHLANS